MFFEFYESHFTRFNRYVILIKHQVVLVPELVKHNHDTVKVIRFNMGRLTKVQIHLETAEQVVYFADRSTDSSQRCRDE